MNMKTILEILKLSTDYLQERNIRNPRREAEDLISDALKLNRLKLYMDFDRPLTDEELTLCRSWLMRRVKGEPLQYIRGEVEFLDCKIKVSPAVLIPRQETEVLADKVIQSLASQDLAGKTLWDVCCGSGCIGIAIKKKFPQLDVVLADISSEALKVAQTNAGLNNVEVVFLQGDLLQPFKGRKTDFLVCNPPYVAAKELATLEREVRDYEPHLALISGDSGLEFYARLVRELPPFLKPGAKAWFELGTGQGPAILRLFSGPPWVNCRIEQDWSGHDRFFFLENQ
jgi:release factor glutamine methyltransferase